MTDNPTFEEFRRNLDDLAPPGATHDRSIYWIFSRKLGLAKTASGRIEIFLGGERIHPRTTTVRRNLEYAKWAIAESGDEIDANRIVFPTAPHFLAVAAFIAVELVRAKVNEGRSLQEVMDDVEPLLELALLRSTLAEEQIIGLLGELLCLEALLDAVSNIPEQRLTILDMWQGHQMGQRDFRIGSTAVEVKTTQNESSTHQITGLHQVEIDLASVPAETNLMLLSIGLAETEHDGQTLPEVVQRILNRLGNAEDLQSTNLTALQKRFLTDVSRYGSWSARGYEHLSMATAKAYCTRYRVSFTPRLYDLVDEDIRILRRRDLAGRHLRIDDIQYKIDLPTAVNGRNPAPNWRQALVYRTRSYLES